MLSSLVVVVVYGARTMCCALVTYCKNNVYGFIQLDLRFGDDHH